MVARPRHRPLWSSLNLFYIERTG